MQYALDFGEDPPSGRKRFDRLFFSLFPDPTTARQVGLLAERLADEHRLNGSRLRTDRLHVSLHNVRDDKRVRSTFVYAARRAADAVTLPPVELTFGWCGGINSGRPDRWPLALIGDGATALELHEAIGAAMRRNGLKAREGFMPHMTLLYTPRPIPPGPIDPIRFTAEEFVLVHSEVGLTRYHILGRWPLRR